MAKELTDREKAIKMAHRKYRQFIYVRARTRAAGELWRNHRNEALTMVKEFTPELLLRHPEPTYDYMSRETIALLAQKYDILTTKRRCVRGARKEHGL